MTRLGGRESGGQWHYVCSKCGWSTCSNSPNLTTCPIEWGLNGTWHPGIKADPCGGKLGAPFIPIYDDEVDP